MTRKPINIARESVGLLFCQREGLESEWCVIHGSTWAPPHEKCCVEGERTVRRIAQAIEAYATEVAEQVRVETLAGFTREDHAHVVGYHHTEPGYWRLVGPKHWAPLPPEPTAEEIAVVKRWMAGGEP